MNKTTACEFFELYKGVMPEFNAMTDYMATNGPVIAMEIRQEEVVSKLRRFCGPHDPTEGNMYAPNTLRSQFWSIFGYKYWYGTSNDLGCTAVRIHTVRTLLSL